MLLNKYIVLETIKSDATKKIYLVRHQMIGECRIIKQVMKESPYFRCAKRETNILRNLRSENIPRVCDIEENDESFYIIEEYIEGKNLYDYIKENGLMSREQAIEFGIKLAGVLIYLHSEVSGKVCHLDIQPKNIILKENRVYLIDFENGRCERDFDSVSEIMATDGFAPPQIYSEGKLKSLTDGFLTDIYGFGKVLAYVLTGKMIDRGEELDSFGIEFELSELIGQMISKNDSYRQMDAKIVMKRLSLLSKDFENKKVEMDIVEEPADKCIVSVVSVKSGAGATYVSFLLADELLRRGITATYEEKNNSGLIRNLAKNNKEIFYDNGFFVYKNRYMKPMYPDNVRINGNENIVVRDEGVFSEEKEYGDVLLLVTQADLIGYAYMNIFWEKYGEILKQKKVYVVFNLCTKEDYLTVRNLIDVPCVRIGFGGAENMLLEIVKYICRESDLDVNENKVVSKNHKNNRNIFSKKR